MNKIQEIDTNFKNKNVARADMKLYNVHEKPFRLYGLYKPENGFRRIPEDVAKSTSNGVYLLSTNTSGGRVRFKTDSEYIAIKALMPSSTVMPHMPVTGSCGFDMYASGKYAGTFAPPTSYPDGFTPHFTVDGGYESIIDLGSRKMRDIIINFPLYNDLTDLFIGLSNTAEVCKGEKYKYEDKPVVYYGSSITQGGCASRPGNSYQAIISRKLNTDFLNLGFSGNAKAEDSISEYIANLDMSVFVYDYDHNAPNAEYLEKTHYRMFKKIRDKNPNLPVIMVTAPVKHGIWEDRFEIIKKSYETALNSGDKNVYFISGHDLAEYIDADIFTVDNCHPNDFGFYCMAKIIGDVIKKLL